MKVAMQIRSMLIGLLSGLVLASAAIPAEELIESQLPEASQLPEVVWEPPLFDEPQLPSSRDAIAVPPLSFPAATVAFGWLAPGGARGFGTADFDVHYSWRVDRGFDQPFVITPGVGYHLWSGPGVLDIPPRVYDLYLDLSWRMVSRDRSGVTVGVTPGYYGDFSRLDSKAFQLTGWILGDWTVNDRWTLLGGLAYVRQLKSNLLPVGGVVFRPQEDTRLELVFPRPRLARRLAISESQETWGYVCGLFGGGAWAVDAGGSNVLVRYSDLRLCLGVEWLRANGGSSLVELGYVFSRDISVENISFVSPNGTAMLQVGSTF
jgi:hypothetical protein